MDKIVFDKLSSFNINNQQKRDLIDVIKYISKDDDFEDTFILNIVEGEYDNLIVKQEDVPDLVKALLDKKQIVGKVNLDDYTMINLISGNQFIIETDINTYIFSVYFNATTIGDSVQYIIVSGGMTPDQIDVNVSYGDILTPEDVDSKFKQLELAINNLKKVATTNNDGLMSKEDKVKLDSKVATKEDIIKEQNERNEADKVLTDNLAAEVRERNQAILLEADTRSGADVELSNKINTEQTDRINADTALGKRIDAEQTARTSADKTLTDNLAKEVADRTKAITAEQTAREQADTAINTDIQGIKDKGSLFDLFKAAGATLNPDGKTWTMNGITDLTTQELINAYQRRPIGGDIREAYANVQPNQKFRTNFPIFGWYNNSFNDASMLCYNNSYIEVLRIGGTEGIGGAFITVRNAVNWFTNAKKLKVIRGAKFSVDVITFDLDSFKNCKELTEIRLINLRKNIYFQDSPLLSKASIVNIIQGAKPSSPITITLHPTAYAMAIADPEIQAELEKQPNISLAEGVPTA